MSTILNKSVLLERIRNHTEDTPVVKRKQLIEFFKTAKWFYDKKHDRFTYENVALEIQDISIKRKKYIGSGWECKTVVLIKVTKGEDIFFFLIEE